MPNTAIFIPGVCGSSLYTRSLNNSASWTCDWLCLRTVAVLNTGFGADAWRERLAVRYDPDTRRYAAVNGEIGAAAFGFDEVCLMGSQSSRFTGLARMVAQLPGAWTLDAVPYDWLRIMDDDHLQDFARRLTQRIELAGRCTLISHSMGAFLVHLFLDGMPQAWKDRHIATWITVNGAFGGSPKSLRGVLCGTSMGIVPGSTAWFKPLTQQSACGIAMLPDPQVFASVDILEIGEHRFGAEHLGDVLAKMVDESTAQAYHDLIRRFHHITLRGPGVPVHVVNTRDQSPTFMTLRMAATGVETISETEVYRWLFATNASEVQHGIRQHTPLEEMRGDGTVPFLSLNVPNIWSETVSVSIVDLSRGHARCFSDDRVLARVGTILRSVQVP